MCHQDVEQLRDELRRLTAEHLASLQSRTFLGLDAEEIKRDKERLKKIRELSADYLALLERRGQ